MGGIAARVDRGVRDGLGIPGDARERSVWTCGRSLVELNF